MELLVTILYVCSIILSITSLFMDKIYLWVIGVILILIAVTIECNVKPEILTKEIDYSIILQYPNSIEITDKHNNTKTIELDSLEEFIEMDNL